MSVPAILSVSGSPVTNAGTFTLTLASQAGNTVFAGPNGASGTPTFRSIVAADVPVLNQNTTGTATYAINITGGGAGGVPYQSAASTTSILSAGSSGQLLQSNGAAAPSWVNQSSVTAGGISGVLAATSGGTGLSASGSSGNVLTSNGSAWVSSPPVSSVPTGTVVAFAGSSAPAGWLLCDGNNTISRTTYAGLFAVIGTVYGSGNGSTTFGVPDMRGRTGVGAGTGVGLTNRSLGSSFGTETHTLSSGEMPSHNHNGSTGTMSANATHAHDLYSGGNRLGIMYYGFNAIGGGYAGSLFGNQPYYSYGITTTANIDHSHSISSAGGGASHNNVQPSLALNYIIKT